MKPLTFPVLLLRAALSATELKDEIKGAVTKQFDRKLM